VQLAKLLPSAHPYFKLHVVRLQSLSPRHSSSKLDSALGLIVYFKLHFFPKSIFPETCPLQKVQRDCLLAAPGLPATLRVSKYGSSANAKLNFFI